MKKYSRRVRSGNLSWWLRIGKGKRRVFIFATSLVVAEVAVGGSEWTNLGAGLIGAFATLIAAVITVRFQGGRQERKRRDKIKSNNLDFKDISEKNSFSALDVLKEGYAKPSLKKCRPIAARNEDKKVFSGRL